MYVAVWKFIAKPGREADFERHYGPDGSWAALFRNAPGYVRTELYRGDDNSYLTVDYWETVETWLEFRAARGREYAALDDELAALTEREEAVVSA
jgi:heme-degrading monooxygenase HmoA